MEVKLREVAVFLEKIINGIQVVFVQGSVRVEIGFSEGSVRVRIGKPH
ncbi:MAG: hypothetical protein PHT07_07520 [Paludibacter sp.]|nr:hypothetical protein [Paludibacter sp.]